MSRYNETLNYMGYGYGLARLSNLKLNNYVIRHFDNDI